MIYAIAFLKTCLLVLAIAASIYPAIALRFYGEAVSTILEDIGPFTIAIGFALLVPSILIAIAYQLGLSFLDKLGQVLPLLETYPNLPKSKQSWT